MLESEVIELGGEPRPGKCQAPPESCGGEEAQPSLNELETSGALRGSNAGPAGLQIQACSAPPAARIGSVGQLFRTICRLHKLAGRYQFI